MLSRYATTPRPETGLRNSSFGMLLFLTAETMFFGALFSSYAFLRAAGTEWNTQSVAVHGSILATLAIIAGLATLVSWKTATAKPTPQFWSRHVIVAVLCAAFVLVLASDFRRLALEGHAPRSHTFFALYFLLMGLIGAHVAAAGLWHGYIAGFGRKVLDQYPHSYQNGAVCTTMLFVFSVAMWVVACVLFEVVHT